jgi:aminoglycoside phosphotransferase (APT) family kinase protein
MTQTPAGFDAQSIGRWIEQRFGIDDFDVEVMSIGRSNLTFTITVDGSPRWVLRRPPLGHEGGSAHNVAREGRIMAALSTTAAFPVPNVLDIVDDPEVLDVPFVFMDHCPGFPINTPAEDWESDPRREPGRTTSAPVRSAWSTHWPRSIPSTSMPSDLSDLRRPGGLIDRQLRRWIGQVEQIAMRETPMIHEVHDASC